MNEQYQKLIEKAGFYLSKPMVVGYVWCSDEYPIDEQLERFAELVRAHEREACARLCEELSKSTWTFCNFAEAIRARGNE